MELEWAIISRKVERPRGYRCHKGQGRKVMRMPVNQEVNKKTNDVAGLGRQHTEGVSSFTSQKVGIIQGDYLKLSLMNLWPPVSHTWSLSEVCDFAKGIWNHLSKRQTPGGGGKWHLTNTLACQIPAFYLFTWTASPWHCSFLCPWLSTLFQFKDCIWLGALTPWFLEMPDLLCYIPSIYPLINAFRQF